MPTNWTRADRPYNPLQNSQNIAAFTGSNGVPLGGIGAGCIELTPSGELANFCTNNNRHRNERIERMPGSFLAFAASDGLTGGLRLLQTASTLPLGQGGQDYLLRPEQLHYDGLYPQATIQYDPSLFPITVSLDAHGTVVPGDLRATAMPAAVFTFTLENTSPRLAWGSLLFSWQNIAGCLHGVFPDGRDGMRRIEDDGRLCGLEFPAPAQCRPNQRGAHALYVEAPAGAELSAARYNTWEASGILGAIEDQGVFTTADWEQLFFSESRDTAALACKVELAPGERQKITFVLAWHYPTHAVTEGETVGKALATCAVGHAYTNHWPDVQAVAREALDRRTVIRAGIERWHQAILHSSLPEWLGRMLINNLYVLSPGTLWGQDGRFSLMETPYGPMMGTLDQRFYSSVGTALFFPELERTELSLFAITQHPEDRGRVYHDLGNLRFDDPKTGTTAKKWTDLNPKFILMACRNFLWSNDRAEIERLWPYMKEMMAYTLTQDTDGDGLPNNEDRSTTYDDWAFFGASSYASSLWVGALAAFRTLAHLLGHEEDWLPYGPVFDLAMREFDARLWDEELGYYRLYNDDRNPVFREGISATARAALTMADGAVNQGDVPAEAMDDHPRINRDCHDGQLAGQWYADMLALGKLFPPAHIRSAVQQIYRRNATPRGMRKGVTPTGEESANPPSSRWWSEAGQGWPGYEVGHYAALAIYQGEVSDALQTVHRVYEQVHLLGGLTWNQPLRWNLDSRMTYGWGCDRYMNSPAVWHVYLALTGLLLNRPISTLELRPQWLPGQTQADYPLITPGNWGRLQMADTPDQRTYTISFDQPEPVRTLSVAASDCSQVTVTGTTVSFTVEESMYGTIRQLTLHFAEEVSITAAGIHLQLTR